MKLAHICPTSLLTPVAAMQRTHLILIHVCQADPEYLAFHRGAIERGDLVILDNGAYELDGGVADDVLFDMVRELNPPEAVLPDRLFDSKTTLERSFAMIDTLKSADYKGRLMAVPQGATAEEWFSCFEKFRTHNAVDVIGIFLKAGTLFEGGRFELLRRLEELQRHATKPIHLLGTDSKLVELQNIPKRFPWVRSTDTTKFVTLGLAGVTVSQALMGKPYPGRAADFFATPKPTAEVMKIVLDNVAFGNKWLESSYV